MLYRDLCTATPICYYEDACMPSAQRALSDPHPHGEKTTRAFSSLHPSPLGLYSGGTPPSPLLAPSFLSLPSPILSIVPPLGVG